MAETIESTPKKTTVLREFPGWKATKCGRAGDRCGKSIMPSNVFVFGWTIIPSPDNSRILAGRK